MKITKEQLNKIGLKDIDVDIINDLLDKYEINTTNRIAGFFAQTAHESGGFKLKEENLNYSAEALDRVFPKYFKNAGVDAALYARQPKKIGSRVYANRMGNGDEASGEGYKFRGRGFIQMTGKNNYTQFAKECGVGIDEVLNYCVTTEGAIKSALFYWKNANCNTACDSDDITAMTKKINGGTNGIADRTIRYEKYKKIFV